jgi:hypothetical protein
VKHPSYLSAFKATFSREEGSFAVNRKGPFSNPTRRQPAFLKIRLFYGQSLG